jgi:hypothetical protein
VVRKFWGIVPITAQDAKTIYEADKDSKGQPQAQNEPLRVPQPPEARFFVLLKSLMAVVKSVSWSYWSESRL